MRGGQAVSEPTAAPAPAQAPAGVGSGVTNGITVGVTQGVDLSVAAAASMATARAHLVTLLVIAVAYFSLGVAVGGLVRRLRRVRTGLLVVLVVPGVVTGLGFLAWIVYSLRS